MTVCLRVELPTGRYDAATADPRLGEWPPHPARLHCALLASARTPEELTALEWLERQGPPVVLADLELLDQPLHASYTVTNAMTATRHATHLGREAQLRLRTGVLPRTASFAVVWPDAQAAPTTLAALRRLCRRVPYVGRSTSPALVTAEPELSADAPLWTALEPLTADRADEGDVELRVAYPGYTNALLDLHADGARAWEADRERPYRIRTASTGEPDEAAPTPAQHDRLIVLELPPGTSVAGPHAGRLAAALRRAVLAAVPRNAPPSVSGHGADGSTHVAWLPLLDIGHAHAQGHAMGVAIALPRGDTQAEEAVATAVAKGVTIDLDGVALELNAGPARRQTRRLAPAFWIGPARQWSTATPVVLDRFPRRGNRPEDTLREMCEAAGLPAVVDVMWSHAPLRVGVPRLERRQLPRQEERPLPFGHAHLVFARPVRGPLLLGRQRYLGMGLFWPDRGPSTADVPTVRTEAPDADR